MRDVSTRRPETMRVVELGGWVAADAKRAVDPELRADGVHWTVRGARALSESWLGPQLLAALRDLDTAARERAKRTSRAPAFR